MTVWDLAIWIRIHWFELAALALLSANLWFALGILNVLRAMNEALVFLGSGPITFVTRARQGGTRRTREEVENRHPPLPGHRTRYSSILPLRCCPGHSSLLSSSWLWRFVPCCRERINMNVIRSRERRAMVSFAGDS